MTSCKFDSLIINGKANSSSDSTSVFESYLESRKKYEKLPSHLKKDEAAVRLNLLKETHFQKLNNSLFRKSDNVNDALVTYWISKVKNLAHLYLSFNEVPKFSGISRNDLKEIAQRNNEPKYIKEIEGILAKKGIIFIIEPSIAGLKTDGAVCKLETGHPVIAMSLRHKRLDNFWFTLMHELSHICLHYESLDDYIVDDFDVKSTDIIELEANKLASDSLIPRHLWRTCIARKDNKESSVVEFAQRYNIHPSIVAGRIQREQDNYRKLSGIVNRIDTREILFNE